MTGKKSPSNPAASPAAGRAPELRRALSANAAQPQPHQPRSPPSLRGASPDRPGPRRPPGRARRAPGPRPSAVSDPPPHAAQTAAAARAEGPSALPARPRCPSSTGAPPPLPGSSGPPRSARGRPLTSVAAGGGVAGGEEQDGAQRQRLGAPHAEVVVDLPLAPGVGQRRHLGSSMTTACDGAGGRGGAALGPRRRPTRTPPLPPPPSSPPGPGTAPRPPAHGAEPAPLSRCRSFPSAASGRPQRSLPAPRRRGDAAAHGGFKGIPPRSARARS